MARYVGTIPSVRGADATFAYMAAFDNVSEWDPSVTRAERLDEGPLRQGSRFEVAVGFLGRETSLVYELAEYNPEARRAVLRGTNATTVSVDTITVAPDGAVTYDARLELKGPGKLLDPILGLLFKPLGDRAANGLQDVLGRR